jgi:hypothetical protein
MNGQDQRSYLADISSILAVSRAGWSVNKCARLADEALLLTRNRPREMQQIPIQREGQRRPLGLVNKTEQEHRHRQPPIVVLAEACECSI